MTKNPTLGPRVISVQGDVKPLKGYAVVDYRGNIWPASFAVLKRDVRLSPHMADQGDRIIPVTIGPRS